MATVTVQPASNQSPDPGQGGLAVTGAANTGHAQTHCGVTEPTGGVLLQKKTCIWTAFGAVTGPIRAIHLKADWSIPAQAVSASSTVVGDSALAFSQFLLEYSVNGGSSWTTATDQQRTVTASDGSSSSDNSLTGASGSIDISIPATTPIASIRLRDSLNTEADNIEDVGGDSFASAGIDAVVSNIRLEVTTQDLQPIVLW
ncbi:MAG TPA: hypothetical protein VFV58_13265 [Blastocatellia bacterium]|jgi:hypothetical protein|nr:hypothetical protein [Blastocatellia bacterium]